MIRVLHIDNHVVRVSVYATILFVLFCSLFLNTQAQNACDASKFSVQPTLDVVDRCVPDGEIRLVYKDSDRFNLKSGDIINYDFGDGTGANVTVATDGVVPITGLPTGLAGGTYTSGIRNGLPYHGHVYNASASAGDCKYKVTLTARRSCSSTSATITQEYDYIAWAVENTTINNVAVNTSYDICEGTDFTQSYTNTTVLNCNSIITDRNGANNALGVDRSQHRTLIWSFDFTNFSQADKNLIRITHLATSSLSNLSSLDTFVSVPSVPSLANRDVVEIKESVASSADAANITLHVPAVVTARNQGVGFNVKLEVNNYCNREEGKINSSANIRTFSYTISTSPSPPTVAQENIFVCANDKPQINVTNVTGTVLIYAAQGANATSLVTGSQFVATGSTVSQGETNYEPTGISAPGVYTYYVTGLQGTGANACESAATTVTITRFATLGTTPGNISVNHNIGCVFSDKVFNLPSPATSQTIGGTTYNTEYLWTVPLNYEPTLNNDANAANNLGEINKTGTEHSYAVRTANISFRINNDGSGNGYVRNPRIRVVTRIAPKTGVATPSCSSSPSTYDLTEVKPFASISGGSTVCYGGTLTVTLSGYESGRKYDILLRDQDGNEYENLLDGILLKGSSQSVVIKQSSSNLIINKVANLSIVRMVDKAPLPGAPATTIDCTNDNSVTSQPTPPIGTTFAGTATQTIMPLLLSTPTTGIANPYSTVCPGDIVTITVPDPPTSIVGGRTTRLRFQGFPNLTYVSETDRTITFRVNYQAGIVRSTGTIYRELTTTVGRNNCPSTDRLSYTINVRELPVVKITTEAKTICLGDNVDVTIAGDFAGEAPTTNTFNLTLSDNRANTYPLNMITRPAGGVTQTGTLNTATLAAGNYSIVMQGVTENGGCTYNGVTLLNNTGAAIDTGTLNLTVRETLDMDGGVSIRITQGGQVIPPAQLFCTRQVLTLEVVDAAGNSVSPSSTTVGGNTGFFWTLPANWISSNRTPNGNSINALTPASAQGPDNIEVVRRYDSSPTCSSVTLTRPVEVVVGPQAATIITPSPVNTCQAAGATSTVTVVGNTPAATETGMWSIVSPMPAPAGVNLSAPNSPTTDFTTNVSGSYTLRWSLTRTSAGCNANSADIVVNVQSAITPTSYTTATMAGPDVSVCATDTMDVVQPLQMAGEQPNTAFGHTGMWTLNSHTDLDGNLVPLATVTGNFADATKFDTTFNFVGNDVNRWGTYIFTWTISASACGATSNLAGDVTYVVSPRTEMEDITMFQGTTPVVIDTTTTTSPSVTLCLTATSTPTQIISFSSAITGIGAGAGSTLAWTASTNQAGLGVPSNTVGGAGASTRTDTSVTYTPRGADLGNIITFTLTSQRSSTTPNTCVSNTTKQVAVRFVRKLEINNVNREIVVCSGDPLNLEFTNDAAQTFGVTYNWRVNMVGAQFNPTLPTPFNSPNATAVVNGQGNFNNLQLNNRQPIAYRARIRVTARQGGCDSDEEVFFVTIMPSFSLTPTARAGEVCSGDSYTLQTVLSEYAVIRDQNNNRIPIQVSYTIEDLDNTQNMVFQDPIIGAKRENITGTANLAPFTAATIVPTAPVPVSTLTIPAANLELLSTITASRTVTVTMRVYAVNPIGTGECDATSLTHTITVNPKPIIVPPATRDVQVCSGVQFTLPLKTQLDPKYVRYRWTIGAIVTDDADDTVADHSANPIPQANITQTITTDPGANNVQSYVRVPYIITPVSTTAFGACVGDPVTITVIVLPEPRLTPFPANTLICSGDEVGLDITSTNIDPLAPTATTYAVTAFTGTTPQFSSTIGTPVGTEDFRMALTSLPTASNDIVNATIRITPTVSYTIGGEVYTCTVDAVDYSVRIAPVATITNIATVNNGAICDSNTFNYTPTSNVPLASGTVDYTWTITPVTAGVTLGNFTVNGAAAAGTLPAFSGTGANIADAIQFNTPLAAPVVLRYTITPRFYKIAAPTGPGDYCLGTPSTVNLNINTTPRLITAGPAPTSTAILNAFTICSGDTVLLGKTTTTNSPASQRNFGVNPNAASIAWEVLNVDRALVVSGRRNGVGDFSATIFNSGVNVVSFEVTFTPFVGTGANRCDGPAVTKTISVNPAPILTTLRSTTVCSLIPNTNPAVTAAASNISFTSPVSPAIFGTTFNYNVTFNDTAGNKVTAGLEVFTNAGTAVTLDNAAGQPHFDETSAVGVLGTTRGGANLIPLDLKVRNATNNDITMVVVFRSTGVCDGPANILTTIINPVPSITNIAASQGVAPDQFNYDLCSNSQFTFAPTSTVSGVVRYKFDAVTPLPAGLSGVPTTQVVIDGALTNISFIPVNSLNDALYFVLNAVAEVDGCDGPIQPIRIKVDPTPTVALSPATSALVLNNTISICYGEALDLSVIGTVANTTFRWSAPAVLGISALNATNNTVAYTRSGNIPLAAPATPLTPTVILDPAVERLINTTTAPLKLEYTITPEVPRSGGGVCKGTAFKVSVTVHPNPRITNAPGGATTICSGTNFTYAPALNVTGASTTWDIISNNAGQPNDIRFTQGTATFDLSNAGTPAITPRLATSVVNSNGNLDIDIFNIGALPATIVFRFTPTLNKTPGNACPNPTNTEDVTVIVQPSGPVPGTTLVRAINHGDPFTLDPGPGGERLVNVTNATYDWTAVVAPGVELRSAANSTVVSANATPDGINLARVTNLTNNVRNVSFTISTNLPTSTCTTNDIILNLRVLPRVVVTITPNNNTICFDSTLGIAVTNNIINANTGTLSLTYDWTATNIGTNVRESGTPPTAVVTAGNNVPLADISTALEQKRLMILDPANNTADENVTYTVTATLNYSYNDTAGNPAVQSNTSGPAVAVVTVVPQPVSSLFQISDATGAFNVEGTAVNATTRRISGLCVSQSFTYFVDPLDGNTGTPGSTYAMTISTDTPPAGTTFGTPVFTPFDNAVFIQMPANDVWSGQIQVVETNADGCVGEPKILQFRMGEKPVAHAGVDITICEGESVTLGRNATGPGQGPVATTGDGSTLLPGAVYNWQPSVFLTLPTAMPTPPGGNSFSIARPTITPTSTITYRLVVSTATGCSSIEDSITITVIPKPIIPTISFTTGTGQSCIGDTVSIAATTDAATTNIEWYFHATNDRTMAVPLSFAGRTDVVVSGAMNSVLTLNAISANGFYFVKAVGDNSNSNVSGCDSELSAPVQINFITPHKKPTLAVESNSTPNQNLLCSTGAESVVITATTTSVNPTNMPSTTYQWVRKATAATTTTTPVNTTTTNVLSLTTAGESGFYAVTATNAGCVGPMSEFVEIIIVPVISLPTITSTSGATGVCDGGSITLTANVIEITNGTVPLTEVEFEWSFTRAGAGASSTLTETGQQLVISNAVASINNGNYRVRVKRNATVGQDGFGRLAGSIVSCFSPSSRAFDINVVSLPPTPTVSASTASPFCGDNGVTREFVLNVAHPQSGATPPQSYGTNIVFKWERRTTAVGVWTEVARIGTLRYALTQASQSGFYRVSAVNTENGASCESPPIEFTEEVIIQDSPNPPNFSGVSLDVCETTTTATTNIVITSGTGPFTFDIQVYIPDADNPLDASRGTRSTRTLTNINNGDAINLLNPDGTTAIPLVNKSSNIAVITYTISRLVDANGCQPSSFGRPFGVRIQPTPGARDIEAPAPPATTANGAQAIIKDVPDTNTPPNMIRTAFVCAGTTARFEAPEVRNTSYTWTMLPAMTLTTPGQYTVSSGGGLTDNFVEISFVNAATPNLSIQVSVTNLTTGCAAIRTLPITLLGQTRANAGTDQSICPESKRQIPSVPPINITYTRKTYVPLGGDTANPTGGALNTVPTSGTLTYLWRKVQTGVPAKPLYATADLIAVPVSEFEPGSDETQANPKVSPIVTSTYVVLVGDANSNCTPAQDAVQVVVLDPPVLSFTTPKVDICITQTTTVDLSPLVSGMLPAGATAGTGTPAYSFSCDNCDDPNTVRLNGSNWIFDPTIARQFSDATKNYGVFNIVVSYKDSRGCSQFNLGNLNVEIFQQPVLTLDPIADLCDTASAIVLEGKVDGNNIDYTMITANQTATTSQALSNSEYSFTGPGVSYDTTRQRFIFDPAVAMSSYNFGQAVQAHSIKFLYKDLRSCYSVDLTADIVVKPSPTISIPPVGTTGTRFDFGICEGMGGNGYQISEGRIDMGTGGGPVAFTPAQLPGVTYTGPGVTPDASTPGAYFFNASVAGVGTHTLTLQYEEQGTTTPCTSTTTFSVTVHAQPVVQFPNFPNIGSCATLFNLTTATVTPDLSAVRNLPNEAEGIYRDVSQLPNGYVDKDADGNVTPGAAVVIRELDASTPPKVVSYQFDPARVSVGYHRMRYDYKDGFGCENVKPTPIAQILVLPPPSPILTPKDPKDTNPTFSSRKPFSTVCPNDSPFEITAWGSIPAAGNTVRYETDDIRLSALITTRTGTTGATQYWFNPSELKNIASNIIDITSPFSVKVKYIVTDTNGCEGFDTQPLSITPIPTATIGLDNDECNGGPLNFTFNANAIAPFKLTYIDGSNTPTLVENVPHAHKISVKPNNITTYRIQKIEDRNGCINLTPANSQATISATPIADFNPNPLILTDPNKTVTFENTSNTLTWNFKWNFGDGNEIEGKQSDGNINITHADGSTTTGTYVMPIHTYKTYGDYRIRLTASERTCLDTIFKDITIQPEVPNVDFTASVLSGCAPLDVVFTNTSKFVDTNSLVWNFGDGSGLSRKENPQYTFNKPGLYKITLTGTNQTGTIITKEKADYIEVKANPDAKFSLKPNIVNIPNEKVQFTNLSVGANEFSWDFGDGNTSTDENPSHIYKSVGTFEVKLTVTNSTTGCTDVFTQPGAISAIAGGNVRVPNVFTPNANAQAGADVGNTTTGAATYDPNSNNNNIFAPQVDGALDYAMQIFDGWGNLIFETTQQNIGWNGYFKGDLLPTGSYIYTLKITFANGIYSERAGDITLIR